jgi:hypothetical protein
MICRATPILVPALLMLIHLAMKPLRARAKGSWAIVSSMVPQRGYAYVSTEQAAPRRPEGLALARVPPSSTPKPKPQGQAEPAGELCVLLLVLPVSCAMGMMGGIKGWLALGAER